MNELRPVIEQSAESELTTLEDFEKKYSDQDRSVSDICDGQVIDYSAIHFHGRIDHLVVILRAGIDPRPAPAEHPEKDPRRFWLGTFDLPTNKTTIYEVTDSERQVIEPFLKRAGGYEIIHTAKSRDQESRIVQLRMGSHVLEWSTID